MMVCFRLLLVIVSKQTPKKLWEPTGLFGGKATWQAITRSFLSLSFPNLQILSEISLYLSLSLIPMDSSATSSIPFNSKNSLLPPKTDELSTKTPEKLPRRLRNREVRNVAAEILRPKSARR
jgi:hypothetical protein